MWQLHREAIEQFQHLTFGDSYSSLEHLSASVAARPSVIVYQICTYNVPASLLIVKLLDVLDCFHGDCVDIYIICM